jgi:hypothetical protein
MSSDRLNQIKEQLAARQDVTVVGVVDDEIFIAPSTSLNITDLMAFVNRLAVVLHATLVDGIPEAGIRLYLDESAEGVTLMISETKKDATFLRDLTYALKYAPPKR